MNPPPTKAASNHLLPVHPMTLNNIGVSNNGISNNTNNNNINNSNSGPNPSPNNAYVGNAMNNSNNHNSTNHNNNNAYASSENKIQYYDNGVGMNGTADPDPIPPKTAAANGSGPYIREPKAPRAYMVSTGAAALRNSSAVSSLQGSVASSHGSVRDAVDGRREIGGGGGGMAGELGGGGGLIAKDVVNTLLNSNQYYNHNNYGSSNPNARPGSSCSNGGGGGGGGGGSTNAMAMPSSTTNLSLTHGHHSYNPNLINPPPSPLPTSGSNPLSSTGASHSSSSASASSIMTMNAIPDGRNLASFVPRIHETAASRGVTYLIFHHMSAAQGGKVTRSQFEHYACEIGMKLEQARKLFGMIDRSQKGYFTVYDWGNNAIEGPVSQFSLLYQRVLKNRPEYREPAVVGDLYAALQLAVHKLQIQNHGHSISFDRIMDAFRFIDRDQSGSLDRGEVEDAFCALDIPVTNVVVDDVMTKFDKDGSGTVDYFEFIGTLFPTLGKGIVK